MKKNLTRVLALAMALLMCLSLLPVSALAMTDPAAILASAQAAQAAAMGGTAPDMTFVMPEQALDYTDPNVCLASEDGQHLWIEVHDPAYICAWGDCTEENPHILYKSCAYCKESAEWLYLAALDEVQAEVSMMSAEEAQALADDPALLADLEYRYKQYIFELPDHFYEKQDGQAPTCTAGGHTAYEQCSVCEEIRGYEELDPLGHNWGEYTVTVEPTCTAAGTKMRECLRCGEKEYVDIPALGHDWGEFVTVKEPTCTETGTTKRVCERCGAEDFGEIPANGHSYGDFTILKEATCTEDGSKEHTCAVCQYKETVVIPAAHTWGDFTVTKEATCTEAGEQEHTCTVCDVTETVAIPAKDHSYGEDGVCTVCGAEKPAEPAVVEPTVEEPVVEESKEEESEKEPAGAQPVGAIVEDCRDMYSSFGAFLAEKNAADAKYVVASYTPVDANGHALGEIPAGGVRFDLPLPEGADAASVQVYTYDYSTYSWSPANFFLSDGQATVSSGAYPYPPFAVLAAPAASGNSGETTPTKQEAVSAEVADEFKNLLNEKGLSNDSGDIVLQDVTPLREDGSEMSNEEVAAMGGVYFEMDLPENYKEGDELEIYHQNSETGEWELITEYTINGNKVVIKQNHFSPDAIVLKKNNSPTLRASGSGIPNLEVRLKEDSMSRPDVHCTFVGDELEAVPVPADFPLTDITYQWYRTEGSGGSENDIPIPNATARTYIVTADDIGYAISCAFLKTDEEQVEHSARSNAAHARKDVSIVLKVKGKGTVTIKEYDAIETSVDIPAVTYTGPDNIGKTIKTITGNTLSFTFVPDTDSGFALRKYSGVIQSNDVTKERKLVNYTVTETADGKMIEVLFDQPTKTVSTEPGSPEDIDDANAGTSSDALEAMLANLGDQVKAGTINYVSIYWDSDSKFAHNADISKLGGVDFELDYPSSIPASQRSNYAFRVYHFKNSWNRVATTHLTFGADKIEVKGYKDFSPFVVLGLPTVTLSFDHGDGTGTMAAKKYEQGEKISAPTSTFGAPVGKVFSHWSGDDGKTYYEGDEITMSDDLTLTAMWGEPAVITFKPGDGSGSMGNQNAIKDQTTTLNKNVFTPPSDNFIPGGWKDDFGNGYAEEGEITPAGNIELTAQWKRVKYTVTYDRNGGGGDMDAQTQDVNKEITVSENKYNEPAGKVFKEWNTQEDGSGTAYKPGQKITPNDDITLYAIWKRQLTVSYYPGDGDGNYQTQVFLEDTDTTLKTVNELNFQGHESKPQFAGWKVEGLKAGETTYNDGEKIKLNANDLTDGVNLKLTAQWAEKIIITFKANKGTGTDKTQEVPSGVNTELKAFDTMNFKRSGFEFTGWNTTATGNGTPYADKDPINITEDTTLYAQWKEAEITVKPTITGKKSGTSKNGYTGEILEVKIKDPAFSESELTFTWYRDDASTSIGTGKTYQTTAADFGHEIFCRASYDDGTISTYKDSDTKLLEGVAKEQDMVNYGFTRLGVPGELATIRGVVPGMKYSVDGVKSEVTDEDMTGNPADNLFIATKMGTYVFYDSTESSESDPVEVVSWLSFGHRIQNSTSTAASGTSNSGSGRVTWKVGNSSLTSYYPNTSDPIIKPYGTNTWIIREDAVGTVDLVMTVSPSSGSYAHTYLNDSSLIHSPFPTELPFTITPVFEAIPNIYVTYFTRSSTSPRTADDSHLGLWSALCFMSLAGATVLLNGQRKRRKARR